MTQKEFASSLSIGLTTYNGYETGARDPKSDFWIAVAQKYGVTVDYLMGYSSDPHQTSESIKGQNYLSPAEQTHIKKYRSLDEYGKEAVDSVLDVEYRRCADDSRFLAGVAPEEEPKVIPLYWSAPAAGIASPILGEDYDNYELKPEDPQGAMFAVKVSGDSMEPYFPDGSTVFCNKDPLRDGDIGVFSIDGGSVIKQYHYDAMMRMTYLFSLNRQRRDADVLITSTSGQTLTCLGRVITQRRYPIPGLD